MDHQAKLKRERELDDLKAVLNTAQGRRLLWRLMGLTGVFESVVGKERDVMYRAGQQDFGHLLMDEVLAAKPEAYLQMISESQKGDLKDV